MFEFAFRTPNARAAENSKDLEKNQNHWLTTKPHRCDQLAQRAQVHHPLANLAALT
jgi:hypothetical protein